MLSPFNYYPISYQLTAEDKSRLQSIHRHKAILERQDTPMADEVFWNKLAQVYKTSEGKIPAFEQFIAQHTEMLKKCIIFVETKEYGETILEIIHRYSTDFHSFYGGDDASVLTRFLAGDIECLLTCHRISEGIDIPSLQNVILVASSRAKVETIQRIGRCLRLDPQNPNKVANVVDFICSDNSGKKDLSADEERHQFLQNLSEIRSVETE